MEILEVPTTLEQAGMVWTQDRQYKINPCYTSTYKLYIKDNNETSYFVGNLEMKPIDYSEFLNVNDLTVQQLHTNMLIKGRQSRRKS